MGTHIEHSQIIEHLADGVIIFDASGTVIDVNPIYEKLSRLTRQELIGQHGLDIARKIVSPADFDNVATAFKAATNGNPIPALSIHFSFGDGSSLPIIFSTSFIKDSSGAISSIISVIKDISDIMRVQEALRVSEERFKSLITTSQEWIWAMDTEGRHTFSNPAVTQILGYSPEEICGMDILSILHEEDAPRIREVLARCIERKTGWPRLVLRWKHRNGTYRFLVSNAVPVLDRDGALQGFQGSDRDITDEKLAEESLKESEECFRNLAEAMSEMVWIADAEGNSIYHNPRVVEYTGMKTSTRAQRYEIIHPDDSRGFEDKLKDAEASGVHVLEEVYRLRRKDGVYRWFIGRSILIRDADNRIARLYGTATDIDDLKKAEKAVKENLEMLAMAERIGKIGSWKQAFPWNNIVLSDGVRRILNITNNEAISFEKILTYIHPDDMARLQAKIQDILEKGTPFSQEYRLRFPDGSIKYIFGNAEATCDRSGKPFLIHGSLQDITGQKLAEEQIRRLLEEKELILREVHHRIKNNMYTIMSLLSLQANMTKEPAVVNALMDASNRMKSMGVLYDKLYRTEGIHELSLREYLPALVDEIIANFPGRHIVHVEKQIDDFMLPVKILSPIGIIVNELITNAMKHAFAGRNEGTLTITAAKKDNRVTISIRDNGTGLPESVDIERSGGFGLQLTGLLAKQLQGTMRIERDGGTGFVLEFSV